MRLTFLLLLAGVGAASEHTDAGYDLQFTSNAKPVSDCFDAPSLPPVFQGKSYMLQGVGLFDFLGSNFTMLLDGFGKLYKFDFGDEKICFHAEMLMSKFYNNSLTEKKVAPGFLFAAMEPPRAQCPLLKPMCNANAPNDNDYVLTLKIGDKHFLTTDDPVMLEYDPEEMVVEPWIFDDNNMDVGFSNLVSMGAAHTVPVPGSNGQKWIGVDINTPTVLFMEVPKLIVYSLDANTDLRKRHVIARMPLAKGFSPYIHAFGITENYALINLQPITMDMTMDVLHSGIMLPAVTDFDKSISSIRVIPLNGSAPMTFNLTEPLFSVHIVNSFENDTAVTFLFCNFKHSPFIDPLNTLKYRRNKTLRDRASNRATVVRVTMHIAGPLKGEVIVRQLTQNPQMTEFPAINPAFAGRHNCLFWAIEYWSDGLALGSQAIVRHDMCKGTSLRWHQDNVYVSEPSFVAQQNGTGVEDDGYIFFVGLHGDEGISRTHVLDASTMTEVMSLALPTFLPFTAHGTMT